jgi:hypothetical protein
MDINIDEQLIWQDLPIFNELMSYRDGLINDYLEGYSTHKDAVLSQSENTISVENYDNSQMNMAEGMLVVRDPKTLAWSTDFSAWQSVGLKNVVKLNGKVEVYEEMPADRITKFPTAKAMMDKYGDDLFGLVYSSIGPYSILQRHVGPENIDGEYIRIHIPLIVPQGDMFLEVQNQEVTWDNIFGFNNQYLHSAHNYSNDWRTIMIVDLSRKVCGLPPGRHYSEGGLEREQPFIRGWQF